MLNMPENCRFKIYSYLAGQDLASVAQVSKQTRNEMDCQDQYAWQVVGHAQYGAGAFDKTRNALCPPSARKALRLYANNIPQQIAQSLDQAKRDLSSSDRRVRQLVDAKVKNAFSLAESHGLDLEADKRDVRSYGYSLQARRVNEIMQHLHCDRSQAQRLEQDEYLWGFPAY